LITAATLEKWQMDRQLRRSQQYSRFLEKYSQGLSFGKFFKREASMLKASEGKENVKKVQVKNKNGKVKIDVRETVRLKILVNASSLFIFKGKGNPNFKRED
jgi:hypothetical protein